MNRCPVCNGRLRTQFQDELHYGVRRLITITTCLRTGDKKCKWGGIVLKGDQKKGEENAD